MAVGRTFILALLKLAAGDLLPGSQGLHGRLRLIIVDRATRPVSTRTGRIHYRTSYRGSPGSIAAAGG